jgi:phosphoserine phosphatase
MDGTLLRGSATIEICRHIGQLEAAQAIENGWVRAEIDDVEFWARCLPLWCDLTDADIDRAFDAGEWIAGVTEVFADIAARGEYSAVITQSPQFFVDRMLRWGVTTVHGAAVELGGRVGPEMLLTVEDKVRITRMLIDRYGLTTADCVAYGDSTSDIGLFEYLPHTVAVNGNAAVRALAVAPYEGWDLREVYAIGRALLDGRPLSDGRGPARDVEEAPAWCGRS